MKNGNISYRSFAAMFGTSSNQYTWTCGHRFSMDSWCHIYTDIISFHSWDDWLVTHLINKSELTHEVVVRKVLGAY